jgi:hypothetical protein
MGVKKDRFYLNYMCGSYADDYDIPFEHDIKIGLAIVFHCQAI